MARGTALAYRYTAIFTAMQTNYSSNRTHASSGRKNVFYALVLIVIVLLSQTVFSQCLTPNTVMNPSSAVNAGTGAVVTINTCSKEGQYSRLNGIVSGTSYKITINNATSKITVRSGSSSGTIVASGTGTVIVTATSTANLYVHWNSSACGSSTACRTTKVVALPRVNSFSPASGCPGVSTVTITGAHLSGATAVTFNGVAAATFSVNSSTSITATVPATATSGPIAITNANGTGISVSSFSVNPTNACYCTPVYAFGCITGHRITDFTLNTLSNNSGATCTNGYSDYTSSGITTTLNQGSAYTATIVTGMGSNSGVAMWIDFNDNGLFEATESFNSGSWFYNANSAATISFTVPASAATGTHRLRIRLVNYLPGILMDPCASYNLGEAEDYLVTIAPACTLPVISTPASVTYSNDPGVCGAFVQLSASVTGTPAPVISWSQTSDTVFPVGITPVTVTAVNACGSVSASYNVVINDNEAPVLTGADSVEVSTDPGMCHASASRMIPVEAADNCGIASMTHNAPAQLAVGTHTVLWTLTDYSGNVTVVNQVVKVVDTELPQLSSLPTVTLTSTAGLCTVSNSALNVPSASDNCGIASVLNNAPAGISTGTTTVTWTAQDIHGNTTTATQQVIVIAGSGQLTTPATISGPASICPTAMSNVVYSTPAVNGATSYNWLVTWPITIVSGQGTNTITVNFGSGLTTSHISVGAIGPCGSSLTKTIAVKKAVNPSMPGLISGPVMLCGMTTATYSVAAVVNAVSYNWTVPAGISIVAGAGTNVISVAIANTFTAGTLSVSAAGNCAASAARTLALSVAPATPGVISGATNVCAFAGTGTAVSYTIAPVANAVSYVWTVPTGAVIVSGQGTTNITVTYASTFTSGSITVKTSGNCGNSAARTLAITKAKPAAPAAITGTTALCAGTTAAFSVAAVTGATTYTWTAPAGISILSGQGSTSISVQVDSSFTGGTLSVTASNACGVSAVRTLSLTNCGARITMEETTAAPEAALLTNVFPNPSNGLFNLQISSTQQSRVLVTVYDLTGKTLSAEERTIEEGTTTLEYHLENYPAGIYLLRITGAETTFTVTHKLTRE